MSLIWIRRSSLKVSFVFVSCHNGLLDLCMLTCLAVTIDPLPPSNKTNNETFSCKEGETVIVDSPASPSSSNNGNYSEDPRLACSWYDPQRQIWTSEGCITQGVKTVNTDGTQKVQCRCSHLTEFGT